MISLAIVSILILFAFIAKDMFASNKTYEVEVYNMNNQIWDEFTVGAANVEKALQYVERQYNYEKKAEILYYKVKDCSTGITTKHDVS